MSLYNTVEKSKTPSNTTNKNPLYANAEAVPFAVQAQQGDLANRQGVYKDLNIEEYKDYTPFDSGMVFVNPAMDNTRAMNQSSGEKFLYGMERLVGTTFTKIMADVGYLGGAIGWAFTGDISTMTDNGFSAYFTGLEEDIKGAAPIYKPSWVEQGGFWDKVGSLSFWMDEGVDGAAFMASAMVPGLALSKGLKLGTKVASILNKGTKVATGVDVATTTLVNTVGEAAVEAKGVQDRVRQQLQVQVDNGTLSEEEAKTRAADAARNTFLLNAAVLVGPNLIQSKWLFGKSGLVSAEKSAAQKVFNPATGELIKDITPVTKRLVAKNLAKAAGTNIVSEGLWEENAQLAIENYNTDKALGKEDRGMLEGIAGNMLENFSTTEGQISMFLGAVLGQPVALSGSYRSSKSEKKQIEAYHKMFGTNYQAYTDNFQKNIDGVFEKRTNPETNKEEYILDEKGKRVVNQEKLTEFANNFKNISALEQERTRALLSGDKTGFDYLNNLSFANWVIPMLESGEASLEMVNKQIDISASQLEEDIKSINEAISEQERFDLNKYKERQKSIAKDLFETIQKETDFSGIWDAPESIKNKTELEQYNQFVKNTIREKAFQQATISWLEKNQEEIQKLNNELSQQLIADKSSKRIIQSQLNTLQGKKDIIDGIESAEDSESKFIKDNFNSATLEAQIKNKQAELDKLDERIDKNETQFKTTSKKLESFTEAINLRKDASKGGLYNLSNKKLKQKIDSDWLETKEAIAEQSKKVEEKKTEEAKAKDNQENKDSNRKEADTRMSNVLQEELAKLKSDMADALVAEEEFGIDPDEEGGSNFIQQKILALEEKIASIEKGTQTANDIKKNEIQKEESVEINIDDVVADAMTTNPKLDPEKAGSFNNSEIVEKLDNQIVSSEEKNSKEVGARSNVVMHSQLESTSIKVNKDKKIFYFNSDDKGNPIISNISGVDFDYVNSPANLENGTEVEYRLVELSEEQKASVQKSINNSIEKIKQAEKSGVKVSSENNYDLNVDEAIGIFSEDKLIGFVQLPHMFDPNSEDKQVLEAVRNNIIKERRAILDKLNKGERVTTTILSKGKGNYFSKHIGTKPVNKNQDGSSIRPISREQDKFEDRNLFAYYDGVSNSWKIPFEKSSKKITKQLEEITRNLNASRSSGYNGQVVLLVRSANGSYAPIPVYSDKLSDNDVESVWNILVENKNFMPKDVITALNPLVFASMGEKSNLKIRPYGENVYLELDELRFELKDIENHKDKTKEALKGLRRNIVASKLNNKAYQKELFENILTTNVIPINDQYFIQPYIQLNSIVDDKTYPPKLGPFTIIEGNKVSEEDLEKAKQQISEQENKPAKKKLSDFVGVGKGKGTLKVTTAGVSYTAANNLPADLEVKAKRGNTTKTLRIKDGEVLNADNTKVTDNEWVIAALQAEAQQSENLKMLGKYKVMAALTKTDSGLNRTFKVVNLQNKEVSEAEVIELLQKHPELDLIKKNCK